MILTFVEKPFAMHEVVGKELQILLVPDQLVEVVSNVDGIRPGRVRVRVRVGVGLGSPAGTGGMGLRVAKVTSTFWHLRRSVGKPVFRIGRANRRRFQTTSRVHSVRIVAGNLVTNSVN